MDNTNNNPIEEKLALLRILLQFSEPVYNYEDDAYEEVPDNYVADDIQSLINSLEEDGIKVMIDNNGKLYSQFLH
ncbi:hypothetical protein ACFQ4X_07055 [Fictibacillus halophilus]|uniref:hypothetical protein n=1 Tax=Fictibacillus halophilus TaxID=1610490 RepID=UPI00363A3800